jgi:hypothetical protein
LTVPSGSPSARTGKTVLCRPNLICRARQNWNVRRQTVPASCLHR